MRTDSQKLDTIDETVPVLIEIVCRTSLRCFEINRLEFSPYYSHDDEVLFLDGNCLKVLQVNKNAQSSYLKSEDELNKELPTATTKGKPDK